jgi:hypothetical protein
MALDGSGGPRKISVQGSDDPHRAFGLDMAGEALRTVARDPAVPASSTIEARPPVCRISQSATRDGFGDGILGAVGDHVGRST